MFNSTAGLSAHSYLPSHNMANLAQLEAASKDLSTALGEIQSHYRYGETDSLGARPPQVLPTGVPPEVHRARESALASLNRLQVMLAEPTDLLKNLASHVRSCHSSSR